MARVLGKRTIIQYQKKMVEQILSETAGYTAGRAMRRRWRNDGGRK